MVMGRGCKIPETSTFGYVLYCISKVNVYDRKINKEGQSEIVYIGKQLLEWYRVYNSLTNLKRGFAQIKRKYRIISYGVYKLKEEEHIQI